MVGKIGSPNVPASISSTKVSDAAAPAKAEVTRPVGFAVQNPTSKLLEAYAKKRNLWGNFVRNNVPQFKPLRHDDQ